MATVSVLLRLVTEPPRQGRVAGHAEIVDTGESLVFKDQDEMLAFLRQATQDAVDKGSAGETSSSKQRKRSLRAGQ